MQYLPLTEAFFPAVVLLANQIHGDNYLTVSELQQMWQSGIKNNINASFIALDNTTVVGFRISYAAGQWLQDKWCSVSLWPVSSTKMAYFKSVGVKPEYRGQGVAKNLLLHSICALQQQGAEAGLAHIWRESPGNAAQLYFAKAGAKLLYVHPDRWRHLSETMGYICPCCGNLCRCTAAEMVLPFAKIDNSLAVSE
ncbi:GNAT family N-acetyltransferase [Rheinheimera baltica]|uniref:GNAT family N-acetyltransferase n=1 Tax=Rheinheimera baltica TaxID=67576 RepID=UPI000428FAB4|nr:GNAT family N-acetyltransferase [Rheinheimera baltica]MDP5190910.1 GNAT family N-acetyltransferase [Rheinheimera baltica]